MLLGFGDSRKGRGEHGYVCVRVRVSMRAVAGGMLWTGLAESWSVSGFQGGYFWSHPHQQRRLLIAPYAH